MLVILLWQTYSTIREDLFTIHNILCIIFNWLFHLTHKVQTNPCSHFMTKVTDFSTYNVIRKYSTWKNWKPETKSAQAPDNTQDTQESLLLCLHITIHTMCPVSSSSATNTLL